jgi:hypothetical protein
MSNHQFTQPFPLEAHKWRVMQLAKSGNSATVAYYIDAGAVMDCLDGVAGPENWSDTYRVLASDKLWIVECTLNVGGVIKTDVGEGDAAKDAYSDALKRAAVKFGIGRYLYGLDSSGWYEIDPYKNFTPASTKIIKEKLWRGIQIFAEGALPSVDNLGDEGEAGNSAPTDDREPWEMWQGPQDAFTWAINVGACENEHEARNSFRKVVETTGGSFTIHTMPVIFAAFYQHQLEKAKAPA